MKFGITGKFLTIVTVITVGMLVVVSGSAILTTRSLQTQQGEEFINVLTAEQKYEEKKGALDFAGASHGVLPLFQ